jgi:hypothetical protein
MATPERSPGLLEGLHRLVRRQNLRAVTMRHRAAHSRLFWEAEPDRANQPFRLRRALPTHAPCLTQREQKQSAISRSRNRPPSVHGPPIPRFETCVADLGVIARCGGSLRTKAGGACSASAWAARAPGRTGRPQRPRELSVHRRRAEPAVIDRHHRPPHRRGEAVPGCDQGRIPQPDVAARSVTVRTRTRRSVPRGLEVTYSQVRRVRPGGFEPPTIGLEKSHAASTTPSPAALPPRSPSGDPRRALTDGVWHPVPHPAVPPATAGRPVPHIEVNAN